MSVSLLVDRMGDRPPFPPLPIESSARIKRRETVRTLSRVPAVTEQRRTYAYGSHGRPRPRPPLHEYGHDDRRGLAARLALDGTHLAGRGARGVSPGSGGRLGGARALRVQGTPSLCGRRDGGRCRRIGSDRVGSVPSPASNGCMDQPGQVDSGQHLVSPVHAEISAAPCRTASSWSWARCLHAAATSGPPSGPASASYTPVCSQSAWLPSASTTARAMSLTAAAVPMRARASAVRRVTAVSSASSSSPTRTAAASGTSAKEARSRPARTRRVHEGEDAPAKAASNPLVISGTTRRSHAAGSSPTFGTEAATSLPKGTEAAPDGAASAHARTMTPGWHLHGARPRPCPHLDPCPAPPRGSPPPMPAPRPMPGTSTRLAPAHARTSTGLALAHARTSTHARHPTEPAPDRAPSRETPPVLPPGTLRTPPPTPASNPHPATRTPPLPASAPAPASPLPGPPPPPSQPPPRQNLRRPPQ